MKNIFASLFFVLALLLLPSVGVSSYFPSSTSNGSATSRTITQTAHGFTVGKWLYGTGSAYALATASNDTIGVVTSVVDANNFILTTSGYATGLTGLVQGSTYYMDTVAGNITATIPAGVIRPVLIADSTTSGYVQQYTNQAVGTEYGEQALTVPLVYTGPANTFKDINGGTFTLPTAGTWEVSYYIPIYSTSGQRLETQIVAVVGGAVVTKSGTTAIGSGGAADTAVPLVQKTFIITTGVNTQYKVQIQSTGGSGTLSYSAATGAEFSPKIIWSKINGFSPVSGQSQDFLQGYVATTYTSNVAVSDHIKFETVRSSSGSSITLDGFSAYSSATNTASVGRILLKANKTYRLWGSINNATGASYNPTQWFNSDTNTGLGLVSGAPPPNSTTDRSVGAGTVAYITPTVDTRVELRINFNALTQINGIGDAIGPSQFTVEQIGTSAISSFNGATAGTAGTAGYIPAPTAGQQSLFLRGDATWAAASTTPTVQRFTASGTYTPTAGMKFAIVEMVGGGGGGGNTTASSTTTLSVGSGGGAGGYIKALMTAAQIGASQAVTIGAGGIGGGTGGNTTLGTLLTANGGGGGTAGAASNFSGSSGGIGGAFTITTGTNISSQSGMVGNASIGYTVATSQIAIQGGGGSSVLGRGAQNFGQGSTGTQNGGGAAATANSGGGGGGAISAQTGGLAQTGGVGGTGVVIVTEFF
jgi:hypothetical protein